MQDWKFGTLTRPTTGKGSSSKKQLILMGYSGELVALRFSTIVRNASLTRDRSSESVLKTWSRRLLVCFTNPRVPAMPLAQGANDEP